mgnify:FL=1
MTPGKIRVLLVDDHVMVREALARILQESERIQVAGQAGDGPAALELARGLKPAVIVLDYSMPGMDAPALLARLKREFPKARVLILTIHESPHYAIKALESGAHGYVVKSDAVRELVEAIVCVHAGGMYLSPKVSAKVLEHLWHPRKRRIGLDALTQREFELLRALSSGKSLKECAAALEVGVSTAATYRARLMEKLKLENTAEIIRFALENDIVG